jgi:hypothetical protein
VLRYMRASCSGIRMKFGILEVEKSGEIALTMIYLSFFSAYYYVYPNFIKTKFYLRQVTPDKNVYTLRVSACWRVSGWGGGWGEGSAFAS